MCQLGERLLVQPAESVRLEPLRVFVERVDEHPERQVALELRRRPREHDVPASVGSLRKLGE